MFSPPLLSQDAVLPWTCAWLPPLQRQLAEMLLRRHSIVNCRITEGYRVFTTARLCGQRTGGRNEPSFERFCTRQKSLPAETGSTCRRTPCIAGGNTKSKSLSCAGGKPWHAQFSRILQRGQSGPSQASSLTELCTTGDMSPLSTAGPATTTSTTAIPDDDDDLSRLVEGGGPSQRGFTLSEPQTTGS